MRIAVFGAGYAGLTVARRLERHGPDDLELVVVDESDTHLVQHELHRLVRYPALSETITVPLDDVLPSATVRQARVTDLDPEAGVATITPKDGDDEELEYDIGAVCLGAETEFYDLPGVADHATPLKRIEDARQIRRDALAAENGNAVVGGGGLSGIQVAGELAALSDREDLALDVTLVERNGTVAPGFDAAFSKAIRRELEAREVTLETGVAVQEADNEGVQLADGRSLSHDVFVWTGGIRGPAALDGERASAASDLQVSDSTYVVGDAGRITGEDGDIAPASAQTAIRQATVAAKNIQQRAGDGTHEGTEVPTYDYDAAGWVVSVGDGAVAQVGPVVMSGDPARAAKAVIGAGHLGSVGAIGNAADLVAEELGWPTHNSVVALTDISVGDVPTDPASISDLQSTFGATGLTLAEAFTPGETLDLSGVTRLGDTDYPGSPANLLTGTLFHPHTLFGKRDD